MENTMPTWEEILTLIPEKVTLHPTDRRDNFNKFTGTMQKCISEGSLDSLYDIVNNFFADDSYITDLYIKDLEGCLERVFGIGETEARDLVYEHTAEILDVFSERDNSRVIENMARNTSNMVMFYDTGHYVDCSYRMSDEECGEQLGEIKKVINLEVNDFDERVRQMMYNASYGGNLVIYFTGDVYNTVKDIESNNPNTIRFSGEVHIAIPNHSCGAGDHTSFNHSFELPFSHDNLFICEEVKYSYTYDVCGMSSNWCSKTIMELIKVGKSVGEIEKSLVASYLEEEAILNRTFKEGGCTYGDKNYNRHRDVKYYNEPMYCRNECTHCHTVWLD